MTIMDEMQPQQDQETVPPRKRAELDDELRFSSGYLLARLGAESRSLWARMLAERDLTPHHFGVLTALAQLGEVHQQRLAIAIGIDARNAVGVIDGLSQRGLLERHADSQDRRRHRIALTAQGETVVAELRTAGIALENEMFAGLAPGDRDALHRLLLTLFDARTARRAGN